MLTPLNESSAFPIFLEPLRVRDELSYRLAQQSLFGEFSRAALQIRDFQTLLQRATELCARGLGAGLGIPSGREAPGVARGIWLGSEFTENVPFAADEGSPAGHAYWTGQTVISNHMQSDARFQMPGLLADHGVKRAIDVLIERGGHSETFFGVLEVDVPIPVGSIRRTPTSWSASPGCPELQSSVIIRMPGSRRRWNTRRC